MAAADDERDVSTTQYCAKLQEWMWSYYWGCAPPVPAVYYSLPDAFPWRPAQPSPAETPHWYSQVAFRAPSAAGPEPAPAGPGPRRVDGNAPQPGREYTIPSPLHRLLAETVDFFILFCVKATVVLWVMHLSGMKDISKFVMNFVVEEIDDNTSLEDLQKMMAVALVYRMLVCFYEIICIWGAGGATPGKFLLGLRVVSCDTSVLVRPNRVLVVPATNLHRASPEQELLHSLPLSCLHHPAVLPAQPRRL
ncbi:protein FAM8A1 isoform X4 [Denticeps clupeoides]|uniref:protein FAM8A1 isoform X4 n=1 Tax=Denticeps clupeoides TaxID=299321 RepID=UPI0010A3E787|nr:protein FAM8A1-like isoform X4 [Denticeps clupeoides]